MDARVAPEFSHVRDWIFDLDNCLYPASSGLFALIDERMTAYIQRLLDCDPEEAHRVQKDHFHTHGTTLAGLMKNHEVDPHHFLEDVHDIPLDRVERNERLARALARLPGRRFVFTNGDAPYARRVLEAIGVHERFDDLHDIHASSYRPEARPARLRVDVRALRHRSGPSAAGRRHGAEPEAGEDARDDHGLGGQWLGAR